MKDISLKDKITQGINDLFYIWKREFRTTFRDQGVLIFFVLVPLVYPLIYSFIYTNEVVREVPAVVVDDSRSSLSCGSVYLTQFVKPRIPAQSGLQSGSEDCILLRRHGRSQTDAERSSGLWHYLYTC